MIDIADRVRAVSERITRACEAAHRDPAEVSLLAASKTRGIAEIQAAADAGVTLFGENYVQELVKKQPALPQLQWHYIGHLQTTKAKKVAPLVDVVQSVDSTRLADALARRADALGVLLQVNIGHEASKAGVTEADALSVALHVITACPTLTLQGLMTIPPPGDPDRWLLALRVLRDRLQDQLGHPLPTLSMGMSADLENAIRHGATLVRVGTAIFGPRPPPSGKFDRA